MKYLIIASNKLEATIGNKLADQLSIQDIRSEIEKLQLPIQFREVKRKLKAFDPDLLIVVGPNKLNAKLFSYAKRQGIRNCYYDLSFSKKLNGGKPDLTLLTLPQNQESEFEHYIGNPILDLVKDYEFEEDFSLDDHAVNIALILEEKLNQSAIKKINSIIKESPKSNFHISTGDGDKNRNKITKLPNVTFYADKTFDLLKQCNLAITSSDQSNLEAVFLNCPQIIIKGQESKFSFFKKPRKASVVNSIAGKQVVKELQTTTEIKQEMDLILNDQQYCATMLDEYQEIKNKIGHERASKKAAQIIVDFLESSSS